MKRFKKFIKENKGTFWYLITIISIIVGIIIGVSISSSPYDELTELEQVRWQLIIFFLCMMPIGPFFVSMKCMDQEIKKGEKEFRERIQMSQKMREWGYKDK